MNIVVLMKRVPDTAARIQVGADGVSVDPAGIDYAISPYDEIALEQAIQLKEAGGGKVTILTLGPQGATKEIRTGLAMGADEGVLLVDDLPARDATSTAATLAAAVTDAGFDLVLAGWKAVDTDDGAVPHLVAGLLGVPCLTFATKLEVADGRAVVHRDVEGAELVVETPLPAVITVQKGLVEPRYTSMKGIMMAKRKKIEERPAEAVPPRIRILEMTTPPERGEGRIIGEGAEAVPSLIQALSDEQKLL